MSAERVSAPASNPGEAAEWIEYYYERGFSDGLPLVPPTRESVAAMLTSGGISGKDILGEISERNVRIPAEKVAINAVMAGCLPEYFPVVCATIRGICHPDFAYHGPATSTGGSAITLIVSGPIAQEIGINAEDNALGPGFRANATIGRAVRLVMMNVLNTRPGRLDRSTLGNPGKYTFCFAENESACPWEPFHVSRGFSREESTVTVYASNTLMGVYNQLASTPEPLLLEFAEAMCNMATPNIYGFNETLIILAGEHIEILRQAGWTRQQVQSFLVEKACRPVADFKRTKRLKGEVQPEDETTLRYVIEKPEDLLIVCAGAQGGSWSACQPGWGTKWTRSITTPVRTNRLE